MTRNKSKNYIVAIALAAVSIANIPGAAAYEIRDTAVGIEGDFVLEPAKIELFLAPGESATRKVSVTNRTDRTAEFSVGVEDFTGSKDPSTPVVLLGRQRGPYSLRDFVNAEVNSFTLRPKQRITLNVTVAVPVDATPGGRYGSVLISTQKGGSSDSPDAGAESKTQTISRLGALFLVRVTGKVNETGSFEDFKIAGPKKAFYSSSPQAFELLFANNGNVHLMPNGLIEVKNLFGGKVAEIEVPPVFSLPDSLRATEVQWENKRFLFGRYEATARVWRGYKDKQDIMDEKTVAFWVIPWKYLGMAAGALLVLILILKWIAGKFEIKRKPRRR